MSLRETVSYILEDVRRRGDAALCGYAYRFDKVRLRPRDLRVTAREISQAQRRVSGPFLKALRECAQNVRAFAEAEKKQLATSWLIKRGTATVGQRIGPVDSAGLYIPGGRFPYPSTVLMTAIPARVAGVKRLAMASPPGNLTPEVLTAAAVAGGGEIYPVGGAGAIAALAWGTRAIPKVDFIVGM